MNKLLRFIFFFLIVRPLVLLLLGLNVRHRDRLPSSGPAIVTANHNSHLDTMVVMSLFPMSMGSILRPVAAADYFLRSGFMRWFSTHIIGIIPIKRKREEGVDPFSDVTAALEAGQIIIIFPEGTRGEPEEMAEFKKGISYLVESHPDVPVVPIFMHGLGKAMPKGAWLPVPFFLDVFIGESLMWSGDREGFLADLRKAIDDLGAELPATEWS